MPTVNGVRGAYLQPLRYGLSETGPYTIYTWEGTKQECLQNVAAIEAAGGQWEMQESFTGAKCTLTARLATGPVGTVEAPIDSWEFFAGVVEKDLMEADNATINTLTDREKRSIREHIQNPQENSSPALTPNGTADKVYQLMLHGLRAARVLAPTLRHTQTVSRSWTIPASFTNVNRIISTGSMTALETIPSGILFQLPNNVFTGGNFADGSTKLVYGWLKDHPTVRFAAGQKAQIEQQWFYGLWPPLIYGAVL